MSKLEVECIFKLGVEGVFKMGVEGIFKLGAERIFRLGVEGMYWSASCSRFHGQVMSEEDVTCGFGV